MRLLIAVVLIAVLFSAMSTHQQVTNSHFVTRAVLYDIPRLKGVPYLEPGCLAT
jgi:hypothetical protein